MNYLSHFFIDKNIDSALFHAGVLMPDIGRPYKFEIDIKLVKEKDKDFINGIIQHHKVDAVFHNHPSFKLSTKAIAKSLERHNALPYEKYKYFIAHILLEVFLDRIIIDQHENILNKFYQILENVSIKELKSLLNTYFSDSDSDRIVKRFIFFRESAFIRLYKSNENLILALEKVCSKVNLPMFDSEKKKALINWVDGGLEIVNEYEAQLLTNLNVKNTYFE